MATLLFCFERWRNGQLHLCLMSFTRVLGAFRGDMDPEYWPFRFRDFAVVDFSTVDPILEVAIPCLQR